MTKISTMGVLELLIVSAVYRITALKAGILNASGAVNTICASGSYKNFFSNMISQVGESNSALSILADKIGDTLKDKMFDVVRMFPGMGKNEIDNIIKFYMDVQERAEDIVAGNRSVEITWMGIDSSAKKVVTVFESFAGYSETKSGKVTVKHTVKSIEANNVAYPNTVLVGVLHIDGEEEVNSAYVVAGNMNEADTLEAITFAMLQGYVHDRDMFHEQMKEYVAEKLDKEINQNNLPMGVESYDSLVEHLNIFYENKQERLTSAELQEVLSQKCSKAK